MKRALCIALALAWAFPLIGQQAQADADEAQLRQWIRTLASDDFGGRKPMTAYEDLTVNYLAGEPDKYPMPLWYHKPCDEYREDWDLDGTLANVNLVFSVALQLSH